MRKMITGARGRVIRRKVSGRMRIVRVGLVEKKEW